jgi:hypothetical protein
MRFGKLGARQNSTVYLRVILLDVRSGVAIHADARAETRAKIEVYFT